MLRSANAVRAEVVGAAVVGIEEEACFGLWGCHDCLTMYLYVGNGPHWGSQPHHEDMRRTGNSSCYLLGVDGSRDTLESRLAGAKKAEKEPGWRTAGRAHEGTTKRGFERKDVVDVEDPCCLTVAGRGIEKVTDSVSKRQRSCASSKRGSTGELCLQPA